MYSSKNISNFNEDGSSEYFNEESCDKNIELKDSVSSSKSCDDVKLSETHCGNRFECGHVCNKRCEPASCQTKKCDKMIQINLPCNHMKHVKCSMSLSCTKGSIKAETLLDQCKEECGEVLDCGHTCQGTCSSCSQGRFHEKCSEICGKTLVCGHKCSMFCWEDVHTCVEICNNKCIHQNCSFDCYKDCSVCQEKCEWKCLHYKCTKNCGEVCDRPACMLGCSLSLPCGHPCSGFCGEPCPPVCFQCHPSDQFNDQVHRMVMLEECGHCFEWSHLLHCLKVNEISLKRCPTCSAPIWRTLRLKSMILYNNWLLRTLLRSETVPTEFNAVMKSKILENLKFLRLFISDEVLCNSYFQLLLQYTVDNIKLIFNGVVSPDQRIILKSLLFIQVFLKEMSNFTTAYDVFSMKSSHRHLIFLRINLLLKQLYFRKETVSSQFVRFECESLKIHRMAVCFLLHSEYSSKRKKIDNTRDIEVLFSESIDIAKSTKAYTFKDDRIYFDILSTIRNSIGSSIALNVNTHMFCKSLNSLMPMFDSIHCHGGQWYKCPNGHVYHIDNFNDGNCGFCASNT